MTKTNMVRVAGGLVVAIGLSQTALAEVDIRLRAGAGVGMYSVDSNIPTGGRLVEYQANYTPIAAGVTLILDNELYVDLVHQNASGKAKFDWSSEKPDFSRNDTTLTIGGRVDNISVYVGYKTSEANTDWPTGFQPDKLTTSGFLAGAGWAIPFSSSAINLGGGVGVLNGKYRYLAPGAPAQPDVQDNPLESDTTVGFSVSAGYTYVFSPHLSINGDLKYQYYNYEFGSSFIRESPAHFVLSLLYTP